MQEITQILITLLAAIAALAVAAKAIAEAQLARLKFTQEQRQSDTDSTTSTSFQRHSSSSTLMRAMPLAAILFSNIQIAFLSFAYSAEPLTSGHLAAIVQALMLFLGGLWGLWRGHGQR